MKLQWAKWEEATKDIRAKQKAIIDTHRDEALKYHKERYLTDSREAIFKPKDQWTAQDRWVNHRLANVTDERSLDSYFNEKGESSDPKTYNKEIAAQWAELDKLDKELKKFNDLEADNQFQHHFRDDRTGPCRRAAEFCVCCRRS